MLPGCRRTNGLEVSPFLVIVAASLGFCGISSAQDATALDASAAEALFRQAREEFKLGNLQVACPRFRAAYELDHTAGALLNIATCDEQLGNIAGAWQHYRELLERLRPDDSRIEIVRERLRAVELQLPFIALRTTFSPQESITVEVDGVAFGRASFGVDLPINPGRHSIVVAAPEYELRNYVVEANQGRRYVLFVEPGRPRSTPVPASPKPTATAAPTRPLAVSSTRSAISRLPTSFWVSGAVGLGGILVGSVSGIIALDRKHTVTSECKSERNCTEVGYAAEDSGRSYAAASTATFAVGAVGSALAILIWFETGGRPHPVSLQLDVHDRLVGGRLGWAGRF